MATTQQDVPYDKIPDRERERLEFLISLYPDGLEKDDIIQYVMQVFHYTKENATILSNSMLKEFSEEAKVIKIISRKNGTKKVFLTDKGKEEILKFLYKMRDGNTQLFFNFIKKWLEKGNKLARKLYNEESIKILLKRPAIACMLIMPHYENDIIKRYASITGKKLTSDLRADVIDFIGTLVNAKFVKTKPTNVNGSIQNIYYLRKEGIGILSLMFGYLRKIMGGEKQVTIASKGKKTPFHKQDWFVLWLSALVSFALILVSWASGSGGNLDVLGGMVSGLLIMVGMVFFFQVVMPKLIAMIKKK